MDHEPIPTFIAPWPNTDKIGHHPASSYVELFWLPILGPTSDLLYRRLNALLDPNGKRIEIDKRDIGAQLGVAPSVARHALIRMVRYGLTRPTSTVAWDVKQRAPRVGPGLLARLPEHLQRLHAKFELDNHVQPHLLADVTVGSQR